MGIAVKVERVPGRIHPWSVVTRIHESSWTFFSEHSYRDEAQASTAAQMVRVALGVSTARTGRRRGTARAPLVHPDVAREMHAIAMECAPRWNRAEVERIGMEYIAECGRQMRPTPEVPDGE